MQVRAFDESFDFRDVGADVSRKPPIRDDLCDLRLARSFPFGTLAFCLLTIPLTLVGFALAPPFFILNLLLLDDGRNRTLLSPFGARTSRNTPSNAKFIFGTAAWLRGLIRPQPGHAIAYVDWSQQEFGIAAALSGDGRMLDAYQSGDPYLRLGQQAGRIPPDGTKVTHAAERGLFKECALAVQYGMEATSLALRLGVSVIVALDLLRAHRTEAAVHNGRPHRG